jgi:hypothetical protein
VVDLAPRTVDVTGIGSRTDASGALVEVQRWFGWLVILAALHMTEQLLFGLDELQVIRRVLAVYLGWFRDPDYGTVLLVTAGVLLMLGSIYGALQRGRALVWVMGFFALLSISEVHHIVESIAQRRYVPGTVTAVVWVAVGVMLARATARWAKVGARP